MLRNWTFTGVICDQYDHNNKNWRQNELKKITLGYGATQSFGIGGHEDTYIYGIICFEIGLLLVSFATNMIIITRIEDKMS